MSSLFKLPHRRSRKLVAAAVAALGILSFPACGSNSNANTGLEAASAPIKEAVAKGIVVAAINSTAKCVESTGALFFHGEDAFSTWRDVVAKAMIKATGDKGCKVGILTAGCAVESQEQRRFGQERP